MKRNGGIIGPQTIPGISGASGLYDIHDIYNYKKFSTWPYTPSISLSESTTTVNETTSRDLIITVTTQGYANNTTLYWTVNQVSGTVISGDFSSGYTGSFTISGDESSATGQIDIEVSTDGTPDGTDTFNVQVRTGSISGPIIATSQNITISDTSTAATTLSLSWYQSTFGATIGAMNVYVVDTSGNIQGSAVYSRSAGGSATDAWYLATASTPSITGSFRIAWHYVSGTSFTGDYAIDQVTINGTTYGFESSSESFLSSSGTNTSSSSTALSNAVTVPTTTGITLGRWNRHTGTTPSSSTGPSSGYNSSSYYLYAETSSPNFSNINMWLFSPEIT